MKKLSLLLLVLVLVCGLFVLTSCGGDTNTNTDSGSDNTDTSTGSQPDEDLAAAYDYVKLTYKTLNVTAASFEVMKNAPIGDKIFNISWSTDNDAITITESEDGTSYVVNVPELGDTAINYTLKFSIENDKGEKKMGSFNLTVPVFSVNTHDQYVEAEDGKALIVQGIVTGIMAKTHNTSTKEESLYLQDLSGNGGYYVYNSKTDLTNIKVGMTVEVRGEKKNYNGTFELVNADVIVIDETIKTVTPVDFTDAVIGAASLDDKALTNLNGMLVTIKGVTLLQYSESNGYHNFEIGNHKTYFRISTSSNCITEDDGRTLTSTFNNNFYNAADVTGIIAVYNSNMYLMPVSKDALTNIVAQEKPDDVQVDITLENTTVPGMIQVAGDTTLPTTFSSLVGVSISWELVDGAGVATLNGATLTVTIPEETKTVKLTATVTSGEVSKTKDYEIAVKPISTITIEEANNIGDPMASNNYTDEIYYITGIVESVANDIYGNLYLVDESGDFRIYIYGLYDATGKVRYDKMDPKPLKGDTITVLSSVGKYSTDVQLKNAKVVEHTVHPDNENQGGGSDTPAVEFVPVNPIVGKEYYIGMTKNGSVYYITGKMAATYYLGTTTNQAESLKVTVEEGPNGTYYLTLTIDGAKNYMDLVASGTHRNAKFVTTAPNVGLSYDATTKAFYKELSEGVKTTFGTGLEGTYTTVGGVDLDAEKNAMLQISFAEAHTHEYTDEVTAPTCTEQGYTTHTCSCGDVVVDTYVDALGHSYVEGTCTVCGATDHEHVYNEVVTAPTCEAAGYTTYTCTVGGCGHSYTGNEVVALGHSYTDGVCANGCGIDDPNYYYSISIADALTAPVGKKVILTGTISSIKSAWSTQYNNMEAWLSDGSGNEILLYRIKTQVGVGDKVSVQGVIGVYNNVNQIAQNGSTVTITEKHTCTEYTDATCKELAACVVCGTKTGELAGHSYVEGTCSVCGHVEGTAEAVTVTASKTIAELITALGWDNTTTKQTFTLDENVTVAINGGTNTGKAYNGDHIRIYATDSPAGTVTISVPDGYELVSIKISTQTGTYAFLYVDGTTTDICNQTVDVSGSSVVLNSVKNGSDGKQVRITAIEVVYKEA